MSTANAPITLERTPSLPADEQAAWQVFRRCRPEDPTDGWLAENLEDASPAVQLIQAAARQRKIGAHPAEPFISVLYDSDDAKCLAAARGLMQLYQQIGEWDPETISEGVRKAIQHPNTNVQKAALMSAVGIVDAAMAPVVVAALRNRTVSPQRFLWLLLPIAVYLLSGIKNANGWSPGVLWITFSVALSIFVITFRGQRLDIITEEALLRQLDEVARHSPQALSEARRDLSELSSPLLTSQPEVRRAARRMLTCLDRCPNSSTDLPISASPPLKDAAELPRVNGRKV